MPDETVTEASRFDPCALLSHTRISVIAGEPYQSLGPSGGSVLALCTYQSEDGLRSVDVAVVDLQRLAEMGDPVDGEAYLGELVDGAGTARITELDGLGDGRAVLISYPRGSQAWAWQDDRVMGTYATEVGDADAVAEALLRALLG